MIFYCGKACEIGREVWTDVLSSRSPEIGYRPLQIKLRLFSRVYGRNVKWGSLLCDRPVFLWSSSVRISTIVAALPAHLIYWISTLKAPLPILRCFCFSLEGLPQLQPCIPAHPTLFLELSSFTTRAPAAKLALLPTCCLLNQVIWNLLSDPHRIS